jgi:integrase
VLGVSDEDRLLAAALPHLHSAIILATDTGMRRGEILTLKREHLDPFRKVLIVSRSKTAGGTGREIPWTPRVEGLLKPLAGDTGPVVRFRGASLGNLKKAWRRALKKSNVPRLRFHDLRHTFNTRLMEAGVSQDVRKALMGHADADINDTYTHVELPAKRAAIAALQRWVEQQRSEADINNAATSEGGHHGPLATENTEGNVGVAEGAPEQAHRGEEGRSEGPRGSA